MKKVKEKLTAVLNAITFAEAGEFDTAREMLQVQRRPQAVLLVVEENAPQSEAYTYAVNLCKRMQAVMEIFAVPRPAQRDALDPGTAETEGGNKVMEALVRFVEDQGVLCSLYRPTGNVNEHLYKHIKQHKEIAAVIYDPHSMCEEPSDRRCLQQAVERVVHRLSIPLVKVLKRQPADAHL